MKIPNKVLRKISEGVGVEKAREIGDDWFYLTLDNYKFVDDGDEIGFVNCDSGEVFVGHLFQGFSDDWKKMRIYYRTVRRVQSRIVEVEVGRNLFFFKKVKKNEAFGVYYMLHGLESGNVVVRE